MTRETPPEPETIRPAIRHLAEEARAGRLARREFMALASVFGASAAGAHALLGLAPAEKQRPSPVNTTTLTAASSRAREKASTHALRNWVLNEFMLSGR